MCTCYKEGWSNDYWSNVYLPQRLPPKKLACAGLGNYGGMCVCVCLYVCMYVFMCGHVYICTGIKKVSVRRPGEFWSDGLYVCVCMCVCMCLCVVMYTYVQA